VGGNIVDIDPRERCERVAGDNPFILEACLENARQNPTTDLPIQSLLVGGQTYRIPGRSNLGADIGFNLTPHWTTSWRTAYDFTRREFASHMVALQRDIHDWRAIFAVTQAPNGNFAFNFSVGLKSQPDLKFDYNRATVRSGQIF
jgi:hypothetical protein